MNGTLPKMGWGRWSTIWLLSFPMTTIGCGASGEPPSWIAAFGFAQTAIQPLEIRDFGYPFVPVVIEQDTVWLPFDTGNMAGITLASPLFQRLSLPCSEKRDRMDSSGAVVSTGCIARGVNASVFGATWSSIPVFEFSHETLSGLVGPDLIPGTRFTLDYGSRVLAFDSLLTSESVPGFAALPLVRSPHHPRLILVMGTVNDREALFEIDTGKSRTTVDQPLVETLSLAPADNGVSIEKVSLGPLEWSVESARVVSTTGTSRGLPRRISLGIGSDVLRGFVFTVDYAAGTLWIENPGGGRVRAP